MRSAILALPIAVLCLSGAAHAGVFDGPYAGVALGGAIDTIERDQTAPAYYTGQYQTESLAADGITGTVFAGYGREIVPAFYTGAEISGTFGNRDYRYRETDPSAPYKETNRFGNQWGVSLRSGYVVNDRAMIYGTLGYERVSLSSGSTSATAVLYDKTSDAIALGGGAEIMVGGPLSVRIDYAHFIISDVTVSNASGMTVTYKPAEDVFRFGVAYHF